MTMYAYKSNNLIKASGAPAGFSVRSGGKRETGENPVRSRHRDKGANGQSLEKRQSLTIAVGKTSRKC